MPITIVASIRAVAGHEELVRSELEKLVEPTRAEAGCIRYDLHRDDDDPANFLFHENRESRELRQTHMDAAHLAVSMKATDGAVERFSIDEMERLA